MISGTLVILESSLSIYMHRMQCILATLNFLTVGMTLLSFSDPLSHSRG